MLARLADLDDPRMEVERDRLLALAAAVTGRFDEARCRLGALLPRSPGVGGPSAAMQIHFVRAWLARAAGDMEAAAEDLVRARELATTGAARGIRALVGAELAHLARHHSDPAAPTLLIDAIDELERAGNLRSAAVQRRDLGCWRLEDGDRTSGLLELRTALPALLRTDQRAAAVGLAEIAAAVSTTRPQDAARLAREAQRLFAEGRGPAAPLSGARVAEVVRAMACEPDPRPDPLSEAEIVAIVCGATDGP